jgi:hypothetical protein
MSFNYKNPISPITVSGPLSVPLNSNIGTNFGVLSIGGYQEVGSLNDLIFTIPSGTTGDVLYSGNTIPVQLSISPISGITDTLVLNSDGVSSGRRRLGMMVSVIDEKKNYVFQISGYTTLFNNALSAGSMVETQFGFEVNNSTLEGQLLIDAWTGSTIEGVSGYTSDNSNWKVFSSSSWELTGGTYYSGSSSLELYNNTGGTLTITGFSSNVQVSGNTGLDSVNNILFTTYNTLLDSGLTMASTVGGLNGGTSVSQLSGRTFVSLFDDLLFPTQNPTYTIPTITMSGPTTSTVEVGSTLSLSLSATGIKNDSGNYTQLRLFRNGSVISTYTGLTTSSQTNVPNQFGYSNPNNPNSGFTISPSPYSESFIIPSPVGVAQTTTTTYNADGNYSAGLPKNNNKGVLDVRTPAVRSTNAPQSASTGFQSSTFTYTGIYPYFYGLSNTEPTIQTVRDAISGGTATSVLASAAGNLTITYNASTQFIWFAHFENYTTKSQWFVAADNKGLMSPNSLFDIGVLTTVSSNTGLWNNVNFYIYLGKYATTVTTITVGNSLF